MHQFGHHDLAISCKDNNRFEPFDQVATSDIPESDRGSDFEPMRWHQFVHHDFDSEEDDAFADVKHRRFSDGDWVDDFESPQGGGRYMCRQVTPDDFDEDIVDSQRWQHTDERINGPMLWQSDILEKQEPCVEPPNIVSQISHMAFRAMDTEQPTEHVTIGTGNIASERTAGHEWDSKTSVLLVKVPQAMRQNALVAELNAGGFMGTFDLLYLPIDPETGLNRQLAHINFIHTEYARLFAAVFQNRRMTCVPSSPSVSVVPSPLQGFDANFAYFEKTCESPMAQPLFLKHMPVLSGTQRSSLPESRNGCKVCRYCTQCGNSVDTTYRFCSACGAGVVMPVR